MLSCNGCGYKLLGEVFELLLHLKKDAGYLYEHKWCCINTLYQSEWIITETLEGHMQILLEIAIATALCLYTCTPGMNSGVLISGLILLRAESSHSAC